MSLLSRDRLWQPNVIRESTGEGGHSTGWALAAVSAVLFLTFLDNTVVSVTLADVQSSLHAGVAELQWVVNGYAVTFAALMLSGGTLGDLFGRKKVMLTGIGVFAAGSLLSALAPSTPVLIAGRAVMGVGAAGSEPGTLSMLRHIYPDRKRRARALGAWGAVSGVALALGPVIGGTLVALWGWRGVFWFNVALGAVVFVAAVLALPESADPQGRSLDVAGLAFGALALGAVTYAIIAGEQAGYRTWWVLTLFGLALAAAAAFVIAERHARDPVLKASLFRNKTFSASNAVAFAAYFATFAIFFFTALYLQVVAGVSAFELAVIFIPMATALIAGSVLAGRWVARSGPRAPMTTGCLLAAGGTVLTDVYLSPTAGIGEIGWVLPLAGLGFGMALVPVTSAALSSVPPERSGVAASVTNTSRELGAVFGVAVLGALVNAQLTSSLKFRLEALGIPPNFQSLVINAVTHGGTPNSGESVPGAGAPDSIVSKVIDAAYGAFGDGLHVALSTAAALLGLAAVLAVVFVGRQGETGGDRSAGEKEGGPGEGRRGQVTAILPISPRRHQAATSRSSAAGRRQTCGGGAD